VVDFTDSILEESLNESRLAVEDAIQFVTARKIGAEAIVTRNLRHFSNVKDDIKIVTPEVLMVQ
jgi:predicted nucleic acid-binding protein